MSIEEITPSLCNEELNQWYMFLKERKACMDKRKVLRMLLFDYKNKEWCRNKLPIDSLEFRLVQIVQDVMVCIKK